MIREHPFLYVALTITSSLLMVYLGFALGIIGVAVAWWWAWLEMALEIRRVLKTPPRRSFDGTTEEWIDAMNEVSEMLENKYD